MIQFANTSNRGRFCILYSQQNEQFEFRQDLLRLLREHLYTVAVTSKKVIMNTSTHNLPSSSLRRKVLHFLLSRIYKLDAISCNDNFLNFFCP